MTDVVRGEIERFTEKGGVKLKGLEKVFWPSIFVPQQEKDIVKGFGVGDEVQFIPAMSKDGFVHISQPVLVKKAAPVIPLPSAFPPTFSTPSVPVAEVKPDWDAKEKRIVRQNCVSNAVKFYEFLYKTSEKPPTVEDVLKTAELFEVWVYRDVEVKV